MKGSAGSGKSVDTAQFYILRLMQDKGRNLMVMRKTEASNLTSTFAELVSAIARMGVEEYWSITRTPLLLRF
ncbi:MAG: phage terminase large subunit, partial [Christensenellaceae bacterium]|nr:phage terminase large subunit [Christensenellaceae bacterium]